MTANILIDTVIDYLSRDKAVPIDVVALLIEQFGINYDELWRAYA